MISYASLDTSFNWIALYKRLRMAGIVAMSFGCGYWACAIVNQTTKEPEKTKAITQLNYDENVVHPRLLKQIGCEHHKAVEATKALNSTASAINNAGPGEMVVITTPKLPPCTPPPPPRTPK